MLTLVAQRPQLEVCYSRQILVAQFLVLCSVSVSTQRAQEDELVKIRKYYETSKEEELKLLDKPEQ